MGLNYVTILEHLKNNEVQVKLPCTEFLYRPLSQKKKSSFVDYIYVTELLDSVLQNQKVFALFEHLLTIGIKKNLNVYLFFKNIWHNFIQLFQSSQQYFFIFIS